MKKIAFIITYFGELPFWFPAFQHSCRYNPDIHWLIFSDTDRPEECSENITFIKYSVNDFCNIATKKIGIEITIDNSYLYKICDFKPAFGLIYEDYIQAYDFWGHCDIDIIWGQIDSFVTNDLLEKYDMISSRVNRVSGHFCLYKNIEKIKKMFFAMPVSLKLLQNKNVCERLDEVHFTEYIHKLITPNILQRFIIKKMRPLNVFWDKVLTTSGKSQRRLIRENSSFKWKQGRVYDDTGKEMMYIHFHILKKMPTFKICDIGKKNYFYVSSFGISEK